MLLILCQDYMNIHYWQRAEAAAQRAKEAEEQEMRKAQKLKEKR